MSIEKIYSSKLFLASTRKEAILAAIFNPKNQELVSQLESYLDTTNDKQTEDTTKNSDTKSEENKETVKRVARYVGKREKAEVSDKEQSEEILDDNFNIKDKNSERDAEPDVSDDDKPSITERLKEITKELEGTVTNQEQGLKAVTASNDYNDSNFDIVSAIKGLLNINDTTVGVNRITQKPDELWIYYDDKINLNNVMDYVIDSLNAAGYAYLEFNRLARSDNAMVFQILQDDTNIKTDSIKKDGSVEE